MALQNDPRMYSGGSERVDTRPHVQLYAQLKQREQARNDAFDEYVRNLNKNINSAGLRNQERPVFEDKLKQWQEFGMQNRDALRNPRKDGGRASMEFQNRYQDLNNLVAESKIEEEKKKPLIEIMTDPAKRDRLNEDELFPKIQSHDQGIYSKDPKTGEWVRDANRRSFNVADLNYNPKPFEQDKFSQGLDDIKPSQSSESIKALPGFKEEVTTTSIFSPEDKEAIAYRAIGQFGQDKGFKRFIKELPTKERDELKNLYEAEFKEPVIDDAQLAAAYGLRIKQQNSVKKETRDDKFAQDKYLAGLRHGYAVALKNTPGAKDEGSEDDSLYIQKYWDGVVDKALSNKDNEVLGNVLKGGEYRMELDPTIAKAFIRQGIEPEEMTVNKDGVVTPKYFTNVDDGKGGTKRVLDEGLSKPLTRTQALLALGVKATTGKQRYAEGKAAVSEDKSYSNQQPATYKGKKITVGVKNGKWYNIETGEELK
jgi:hypothetical protein